MNFSLAYECFEATSSKGVGEFHADLVWIWMRDKKEALVIKSDLIVSNIVRGLKSQNFACGFLFAYSNT